MTASTHRFRDEWLVRLVEGTAGIPAERIEQWRTQQASYLSQAILDADAMTFAQLAEVIRAAFRIGATELLGGAPKDLAQLLPEKVMRKYAIIAVEADQRNVTLAMANPLDEYAVHDVQSVTGRSVNPLFCPPATLERASLEELAPDAIVFNLLKKFESNTSVEIVERESDVPLLEDKDAPRAPVMQLADNIIGNAVLKNASDIHIEHDETSTLVRYRVDGLLKNIMVLPRYVGAGPLVSRIKIMAGLDVSDRMRPQDGRAKLRVGSALIGLRVSTLPARTGEKVVLRILNERAIQAKLPQLGFHPDVLARFSAMLALEQGMVLVTGPTGSGKTTTLYAALNHLHGETVNVVTVEDPIEYRLGGITQVQVNEKQGLTFGTVLRSVLRQDPDVVMVGEIRDRETAQIAVQAALTGHLVLSTLHTNDSIGAVTRLADMGIEGFKLASGLAGVTAQRLVRRACPACAQPADPSALPERVRALMEQLYGRVAHVQVPGCAQCGFTGFKGRLPLIELLDIGGDLKEAISRGDGDEPLRRRALAAGALHTIEADALWHVLEGRTTFEQAAGFMSGDALKSDAVKSDAVKSHAVEKPTPVAVPEAAVATPMTVSAPGQPPGVAEPASAAPPVPALPSDGDAHAFDDADGAKRPHVLVAVSDPMWTAILQGALAGCPADVSYVNTGLDVLARVAAQAPEVLLTTADLTGLNAEQVVRGIRTVIQAMNVGILALLPAADPAMAAALMAAGADDVLVPPIDATQLRARVEAMFRRDHMWSRTADVMKPPTPVREPERLAALGGTGLLDTQAEERFDRFTQQVTESFGVPMSVISLVDADRQWFKSRQGIAANETPRDISFCGHAINHEDVFVVEDAYLDARFSENPLVTSDPSVRFYAGAPITVDGQRIGMLCALGHEPRQFTDAERARLTSLAREVEAEIGR
jgi:type IV pilus assembly protein PilB